MVTDAAEKTKACWKDPSHVCRLGQMALLMDHPESLGYEAIRNMSGSLVSLISPCRFYLPQDDHIPKRVDWSTKVESTSMNQVFVPSRTL